MMFFVSIAGTFVGATATSLLRLYDLATTSANATESSSLRNQFLTKKAGNLWQAGF
jgi:hypothetical protein